MLKYVKENMNIMKIEMENIFKKDPNVTSRDETCNI